jgi:putative solute:sodium symporter small subunit
VAVANDNSEARQQHWEKTRNLTFLILILWVIFAIIIPWFAYALNSMNFLGFPLGYYMCVQGSLIAFVAMIWFQNWRHEAIDDEFGVNE